MSQPGSPAEEPDPPPGNPPRVTITYCTQCRWLLRATWLASELLTTFTTELGEVALKPGTGGVFRIELADELVWDRERDGGFPEAAPLKRLVRDRIAPGRSLGHSDRA
jgi:selenoprotein W-related protein